MWTSTYAYTGITCKCMRACTSSYKNSNDVSILRGIACASLKKINTDFIFLDNNKKIIHLHQ